MTPPGGAPAWQKTACPMDCPDACALEARVEEGRVTALRATMDHPDTAGFMCAKMGRYPERNNSDLRVLTPLARRGPKGSGTFEPASWDAALDLVATRLDAVRRRSGGEAILPYHYDGSNGLFAHDTVDEVLWRKLGASRLARTLCAAPATEAGVAIYGKMAGVAFSDFAHPGLIIIWGANPSDSNIHLVPHLLAARRAGTRLVVIDPRRTPIARHADLHIPVWPGSDLAVALWLIGEIERRGRVAADFLHRHTHHADLLLDEARAVTLDAAAARARVPASDLVRLADLYLDATPALIRIGWGPERNRHGDGAMAAILSIPAIAGKFGVRGGGYTLSNSGAYRTRADAFVRAPEPAPAPRLINMVELGRVLGPGFAPPIEALVIYDANPMVSTPDQGAIRRGLERENLFVVVIEQVLTDTCRYADVVLPASTFLEQHELHRGYGAMVVQRIRPAVAPRGEARSNPQIFAALAARLGIEDPELDTDPDRLTRAFVAASPGLPPDALRKLDAGEPVQAATPGGGPPVQFVNVFPNTPDGKADLHPDAWRKRGHRAFEWTPEPASEAFPLALISPATRQTINSVLGEFVDGPLPCHLAPEDARARGICEGNEVEVRSTIGAIRATARIDDTLRQGVVMIPKGRWLKGCASGANANALIADKVTPISGGATYNDARVEVSRTARAAPSRTSP